MSTLSLYVAACRLVLQANAEDQSSYNELYRILPFLRQALSCTLCNSLSVDPVVPPDAKCEHHFCRKCAKNAKTKINCDSCRYSEGHDASTQLRILLQCYKKLCSFLTTTPIFRMLGSINANGGTTSLADMIQEGSEFSDDYNYSSLPSTSKDTSENATVRSAPLCASTPVKTAHLQSLDTSDPEISFKQPQTSVPTPTTIVVPPVQVPIKNKGKLSTTNKRRGCRCGNASPSPGKLTCCGQRCPCYVNGKGCLECNCRGCRNPKKFVPAERVSSPLPASGPGTKIEIISVTGSLLDSDFYSRNLLEIDDSEKLSFSESSDIDIDV